MDHIQKLWQKPHVLMLSALTLTAFFGFVQAAWTPADQSATSAVSTPPAPEQSALPQVAASSAPAQPAVSAAQPAVRPAPVIEKQTYILNRGGTVPSLLRDLNIVGNEVKTATSAIRRVFDLNRVRQGQNITLTMKRDGKEAELLSLAFRPEATTEITLSRASDGSFKAEARPIPTSVQRFAATATIESSLFGAGQDARVPQPIMRDFLRLFSYQVDFQRDLHPGDRFYILYDQTVTRDNIAVGAGQIAFAGLESHGRIIEIYRYKMRDGSTDYFTAKGESIRRGLLRTPVDGAHITSGFGMRMHPILGFTKMHKGVDFGAPYGSPIFAAGDGVIEEEGWKGSYGRYIRIRHNTTLGTAYAHMSGFSASVHKGSHVRQGQVIGYIGMTGRATGPHLHYEVLIHGVQVNPMSVNIPTSTILTGHELANFRKQEDTMLDDYQDLMKSSKSKTVSPMRLASADR